MSESERESNNQGAKRTQEPARDPRETKKKATGKETGATLPIKQGQDRSGNHGQSRQKTHRGPAGPTWTPL